MDAAPTGQRAVSAEADVGSEAGHLIEAGVRLSASTLWDLQRSFYEQRGPRAWSEGTVPFYVTCNPFMARAYARVVVGFLRDCAARAGGRRRSGEQSAPIYIVDLGAGSGRFAFLLLRQLRARFKMLPLGDAKDCLPRFCYVMTDVAEANLRAWQEHPALQALIAEGLLDFARFDAENDRELTLLRSGTRLAPGTVTGPVVAIANYLFDSLKHDAWRIEEGELREGLITLHAHQDEPPDLSDPGLIGRLGLQVEYAAAPNCPYGDPPLDRILAGYRARLGDTSILMPVGALRCLRALADLLDVGSEGSEARLLLLSADKGHSREADLLEQNEPSLAMHGSFSLMVNYHAIGEYVRDRGGIALHAPAWDGSLSISAFVLGGSEGTSAPDLREIRLAFQDETAGFGPFHYHTLLRQTMETVPSPSLDHVLALLHLSDWDPYVMMRYSRAMIAAAPAATPSLQRELMRGLDRVWDGYFPIGETEDLPFEIGMILHAIPRPAEAIRYYERSLALFGEHHATHTNIGLCLYRLARLEDAQAAFDRALACNPGHGTARDWRIRVEEELAGGQRISQAASPLARD